MKLLLLNNIKKIHNGIQYTPSFLNKNNIAKHRKTGQLFNKRNLRIECFRCNFSLEMNGEGGVGVVGAQGRRDVK